MQPGGSYLGDRTSRGGVGVQHREENGQTWWRASCWRWFRVLGGWPAGEKDRVAESMFVEERARIEGDVGWMGEGWWLGE